MGVVRVARAVTAWPLQDVGVRCRAPLGVLVAAIVPLGLVTAAHGASAARPGGPGAHLARAMSLNESGRLQLTSKMGFTLNERGSTSGTITGAMYIHLNLASSSRVTAEVNIYPRGGSLTGTGSASYRVEGGVAAFSGTLSITRGTGKYAHARASGLRFTGTIQRRNDAVSVQLSGPLSY